MKITSTVRWKLLSWAARSSDSTSGDTDGNKLYNFSLESFAARSSGKLLRHSNTSL